jgi:nicotinamidase-related amidase
MNWDGERFGDHALVVVDMQNDFVRAGAPLEVPEARPTIAVQRRLIAAFRRAGRPVVFTRFLSTTEESLLWNWSPACAPPTRCCWRGHSRHYPDIDASRDCAEVIDELAPEPGDLIVDKYGYGAFHGTGLAYRLRERGIRSLFVTGTVTQICVEETAREAFHEGFLTTIVSDAVSTYAAHLGAATLENFSRKFGWVATSEDVLAQLISPPPR